jgi:hypothetical protein
MVGEVIVNRGERVRPSQLIASVRPAEWRCDVKARRWYSILLVSAASVLSLHSSYSAPVVYTRTASFSCVRGSYSQLFAVVERMRSFLEVANSASKSEPRESLRLSAGGAKVELTTGFSQQDLAGAPDSTTDIWYSYRRFDAPLSAIDLRLGDYSREVTVSGTSREQVDGLVGLLVEELGHLQSGLGGPQYRMIAGLSLIVIGGVIVGLGTSGLVAGFYRWLAIVSGLGFQLAVWVLPFESWFPGTTLFRGDASFLVRNSPLFTFLGAVLTVVTFLVTIAYSAYKQQRSRDVAAEAKPEGAA